MDELTCWRIRVLDAAVLGERVLPPAALRDALQAWKAEAIPAAGEPMGVDPAGIDADMCAALRWCGVPLVQEGGVRWGDGLVAGEVLHLRDGVCHVPPAAELRGLHAIELRPLRMWVAERFGVRLQAAPGIRMWLWPRRSVLVSEWDIPLSGFAYGPTAGQRTSVSLPAFGAQVIDWMP
jgi:hypothetical protein